MLIVDRVWSYIIFGGLFLSVISTVKSTLSSRPALSVASTVNEYELELSNNPPRGVSKSGASLNLSCP